MNDDRSSQPLLRPGLYKSHRAVLLSILLVASLLAVGFAWRHHTVYIVVDGNVQTIGTFRPTVSAVLQQAGVALGPQDVVRPAPDSRIYEGERIQVYRAVPVTVEYAGQGRTVLTGEPTVGEVVAALGLDGPDVKIVPAAATPTTAGLDIKIIALAQQVAEREEDIPYPEVTRSDTELEKGSTQVVQQGAPGRKRVTYRVYLEDGQPVREEVVAETVVQEPTPRLVAVGTRDVVETSRGMERFSRVRWMEATAYYPTDGSSHGLTATGIPARYGIVAVDPAVIPLGTRLYIPGYGLALAADTGGDIVGDRIDLCMEDYEATWQFGRRLVKVYILK